MIGRLTLDEKVLTIAGMARLEAELTRLAAVAELRALVVTGAGPHFSFGASVEEHLPGKVEAMIDQLGRVVRALLTFPVPVAAAVRGQCLGGGLELALTATRIFASDEARFAQPELRLGVLAPVGAALLPSRIGQARAEELLVTGRVVRSEEALRIGLVDELATDPLVRAEAWAHEHLEPLSGPSLRLVHRAVRGPFAERAAARIAELEQLYKREVASSPDALEGLHAFLEKRTPRWGRPS